jgi:thioredoxin-like negative regulator of GroEL
LALAVTAGILLNLALLGTFGWDELFDPVVRRILWWIVGLGWVISALLSLATNRRQALGSQTKPTEDDFGRAIEQYLKGDYFQAERALANLLREDARDVDARLMLATLWRHTGRFDEAAAELEQLTCLDGAEKWEWEIQRERELLTEAQRGQDRQHDEQSSPESTDPVGGQTRAA